MIERQVTVPYKATLVFGMEGFHYADTGVCNLTDGLSGCLMLALLPKKTLGEAIVRQRFSLLHLGWTSIETISINRRG